MSTLGTFSEYADFGLINQLQKIGKQIGKRGANANNQVKKVVNQARRAVEPGFKAKEDLAKSIRTRNILVGSGLGVAGLGTAGAIALSNSKKKSRAEMSAQNSYSLFAKKTYGDVTDAMRVGGAELDDAQKAKIKAVKDSKLALDADQRKAVLERSNKMKAQRGLEKATDTGAKFDPKAGMLARGTALAGSPERDLIRSGKGSSNKFVQGLAEGAEKFGRAGYQTGATGLRKVGNAIVGRTGTGKIARVSAAGAAIGTIGAVMRNKREQ